MFYTDLQKNEMMALFERILSEQEVEQIRSNLQIMTLTELRGIAQENIERIISTKLLQLGIAPHMLGYRYLCCIIFDTLGSPDTIQDMAHNCYIELGKRFNKSPLSVERAIRLAISNAWDNNGEIHGLTQTKYRPTNREFISMVAEKIRLKYF